MLDDLPDWIFYPAVGIFYLLTLLMPIVLFAVIYRGTISIKNRIGRFFGQDSSDRHSPEQIANEAKKNTNRYLRSTTSYDCKPKARRLQAAQLVARAEADCKGMLTQDEWRRIYNACEDFVGESKMFPVVSRSIEDFDTYWLVYARSLGIFIRENFQERFSSDDELVKLAQFAILQELSTTLESQKKSPNSISAIRLADMIINQVLARHVSLPLLIGNDVFEEYKKETRDMTELLAKGNASQLRDLLEK